MKQNLVLEMINGIKPRLYQETIFSTAAIKNTLVVLPTGMGKTVIALMLAVQRLKQFPESKILILSPTRPLINQHMQTFSEFLNVDEDKMTVFTGMINPKKREELWKEKQIIFSTPQGLENDVISRRIKLEEVSLLVFDEAHRATGDYAYVFVAKQYMKKANFPRILGLTASPGSDVEKVTEVVNNLYVEDIEVRTNVSPDVKPYIQEVKTEIVKVKLPESFKEIKKYLDLCYKNKLKQIKGLGYLNSIGLTSKTELLKLQAELRSRMMQGERDFEIMKSISLAAEATKVSHALELIETQGITALEKYFQKINGEALKGKSKAAKNLAADNEFKTALHKTTQLIQKGVEHPKVSELREIVRKEITPDSKIIVFTQYRDSATKIQKELSEIKGVKSVVFVGQAKKAGTGLSQKEQIKILDDFREGVYNVVIMTSVGEEGLDIPSVDLVIFHEPIPSAIRSIQRRGRTGRQEKGRVIMLSTQDTRDEAYRWTAIHKERKMHKILQDVKKKIKLKEVSSQTLEKYIPEEEYVVYADHREKANVVVKELIDMGIQINLKQLPVGDYVLSRDCGVEFKTVGDFVDSIIDGRLLNQLKELKRNFVRPLVVIEGGEELYAQRNIHPNAIRGMLATITVSYGIPLIQTKDHKDTASLFSAIVRREQAEKGKDYSLHTSVKPMTGKEQQEYIVGSLPNVGPKLAKDLLKEFKTIRKIVTASKEDLQKVEKVGSKIASEIKDSVEKEYEED